LGCLTSYARLRFWAQHWLASRPAPFSFRLTILLLWYLAHWASGTQAARRCSDKVATVVTGKVGSAVTRVAAPAMALSSLASHHPTPLPWDLTPSLPWYLPPFMGGSAGRLLQASVEGGGSGRQRGAGVTVTSELHVAGNPLSHVSQVHYVTKQ